MEEEGLFAVSTLARWDGEEEPSVEYFSIEYEWDIDPNAIDFSKSRGRSYLSCATRRGRVFYSQSSIDEFVIHCCEPDGTPFLLIEDEDVHRVRKSEDEIQAELDALNSWVIRGNEQGFLAYNASYDQYQRVYMLELTEAE